MSFHAIEAKAAQVSIIPVSISTFQFATSSLSVAHKAVITPTSASIRMSGATTALTTAFGIFISSGTNYEVYGPVNLNNMWLVGANGEANVSIELYR